MSDKPTCDELQKKILALAEQCHKHETTIATLKKETEKHQKRIDNTQIEEKLSLSEERYRALYENAPLPYQSLDDNGCFLDVNPAWLKVLGYSREEVIGNNYRDLLHPDWQQHFDKNFPAFKLRGYVEDVQFKIRHKDGHFIDISFQGCIGYNPDGSFRQTYCVFEDITKRKQAELKLQLNEYYLGKAQELGKIGTWVLDLRGNTLIWTDENCRIFGVPIGSIVNYEVFLNKVHPEDRNYVDQEWKAALEGKPYDIEHRLLVDGKTKWVREKADLSFNEEGEAIKAIGVTQDISERKSIEEERLKFETQMLHAQKLESLGVLAGGIAHDFNNLLAAIMGHAEMTRRRLPEESPAIDSLRHIEKATERAADLSKQMLAYSGKGKFLVQTIDLNRLLEEMLHMLKVSISKKVVLRLDPYRPLPAIDADTTQLRQVIMNLVINASEAIGEKSGVISITTGCMDCETDYLERVWLNENLKEGLYVYLEVADTGCGMEKETLDRLFDPFFTTKFTGRGLGMSAVMGIIRGHNGAIKVYSEVNKGTTFKVLLPASEKASEAFDAEEEDNGWHDSGKVLIVDDEESVRAVGLDMLKEIGYTPLSAKDGLEALKIYKENLDIKFILLDLTMPKMDGVNCFRELKKLNTDIRVIISSGYNEFEVSQKFIGRGIAGFVQKPYKLSALKQAIKNQLL